MFSQDGTLPRSVNAPIWCIMISALGLVTGLATYGYNVTRAMGTRMAKLSPTRGFAAELSTALVIMVASQVCCFVVLTRLRRCRLESLPAACAESEPAAAAPL